MKKEVKYYLEDLSKLKEISQSELDEWIAEVPFHQPLQMLAGIKAEMEGHVSDENQKSHAAYFAVDFEPGYKVKSKKGKKSDKKTIQKVAAVESIEDVKPKPHESIAGEEKSEKAPVLDHENPIVVAENETNLEIESIEGDTNLRIVSSELADETLEDEVINEILEEKETADLTASVIDIDKDEKKVKSVDEDDDEEENEIDITSDNDHISEVDYSSYVNVDLPPENQEEKEGQENLTLNISDVKKSKKKKKKKKEKKKAKEKKAKEKKKTKKEKTKKEKKSKKRKEDQKKKETTAKQGVKKKSAKADIKPEEAKVLKMPKQKKKDSKKKKKKVENVIVDAPKDETFKLKDYDGVSNYTSWLLEQESINDNDKKVKSVMKKAKKKKKKKKKSKKLKIAVDSLKKRDSIISEPLAEILASQGHKKKARKMYEKLAKVFPNKKAYYEEKIEALKKNKD